MHAIWYFVRDVESEQRLKTGVLIEFLVQTYMCFFDHLLNEKTKYNINTLI